MHRSRAPLRGQGVFFVAQFSADYITNMPAFDLRQAQPPIAPPANNRLMRPRRQPKQVLPRRGPMQAVPKKGVTSSQIRWCWVIPSALQSQVGLGNLDHRLTTETPPINVDKGGQPQPKDIVFVDF